MWCTTAEWNIFTASRAINAAGTQSIHIFYVHDFCCHLCHYCTTAVPLPPHQYEMIPSNRLHTNTLTAGYKQNNKERNLHTMHCVYFDVAMEIFPKGKFVLLSQQKFWRRQFIQWRNLIVWGERKKNKHRGRQEKEKRQHAPSCHSLIRKKSCVQSPVLSPLFNFFPNLVTETMKACILPTILTGRDIHPPPSQNWYACRLSLFRVLYS